MTDFSEKNILGIDSSTRHLKLGVRFGGDRLIKADEEMEQSHSRLIIKKTDELFQSAGMNKDQLDAIVVCIGPGSFTGLRIGLAAAKGMAVALDVPVVGVDLFEVLAFKLREYPDPVKIVIPLKRDEFFVTTVKAGQYSRENISVVAEREFGRFIDASPVAAIEMDFSSRFPGLNATDLSGRLQYDASELIYLGTERLSKGEVADLASLEPLYLQKSQAEINFELKNKK